MQILHGLEGLRQVPAGAVLSVGNFDGVHRGHQSILRTARELGTSVGVVTFEPHPLTVLRPALAPPRLTTLPIKEELLAAHGVKFLVVLPPSPQVLNLTAEEFWQILRDEVCPSHLVEGESFNFGKGRGGNIDRLREWAGNSSVELRVVEPVRVVLLDKQLVQVTSSLIRWLLQHGRARDAGICLGRGYELRGMIVRGHARGKAMGVPTANLEVGEQLVPADGVYAGRCQIDGRNYPTAVSIGTLPTFGQHTRQVEAHLIGFTGDLYGRSIALEITDWLRDQRKFDGVERLKAQIDRDLTETRRRVI